MRSSNIVGVYFRKKGETEWQDATAPVWFRRGKEAFMKKINEEDWGVLGEKKGV